MESLITASTTKQSPIYQTVKRIKSRRIKLKSTSSFNNHYTRLDFLCTCVDDPNERHRATSPSSGWINTVFTVDSLELHCGSVRSVTSVACVKMLNFIGRDWSVGQSDRVMRIYANTLSNEIAFLIQPGKTHGHVKKPPSIDGRVQCERGVRDRKSVV